MRIVLVPHDPAWSGRFVRERERIGQALGPRALSIDHVGSTAVPGLAAKPIVDVMVTVLDADADRRFREDLERVGYELRVSEPGHRMFRTREHDVQVHVWSHGDSEIARCLAFRDRLRSSSTERVAYERLKRALAARDWPSVDAYAEKKGAFIEGVLARASSVPAGSPRGPSSRGKRRGAS